MPLIVTRPQAQAGPLVTALQALGQAAVALPLIQIAPPTGRADIQAAWRRLAQQALVMFVSANAVEHFFQAAPAGQAWPSGVLAGATGPGTANALRAAGVHEADLVQPAPGAPQLDSEALWARLQDRDWQGRAVLIVRGEDGRDWLADTLRAQGAQVTFLCAYRRLPPRLDPAGQALLAAALAEPASHLWLFSSSQAVANLRALQPQADWSACGALATHPRVAQAACEAGFVMLALVPSSPEAIVAWLKAARRLQSGPQ